MIYPERFFGVVLVSGTWLFWEGGEGGLMQNTEQYLILSIFTFSLPLYVLFIVRKASSFADPGHLLAGIFNLSVQVLQLLP